MTCKRYLESEQANKKYCSWSVWTTDISNSWNNSVTLNLRSLWAPSEWLKCIKLDCNYNLPLKENVISTAYGVFKKAKFQGSSYPTRRFSDTNRFLNSVNKGNWANSYVSKCNMFEISRKFMLSMLMHCLCVVHSKCFCWSIVNSSILELYNSVERWEGVSVCSVRQHAQEMPEISQWNTALKIFSTVHSIFTNSTPLFLYLCIPFDSLYIVFLTLVNFVSP